MNINELKIDQKVQLDIRSRGIAQTTEVRVNEETVSEVIRVAVEIDAYHQISSVTLTALRPSLEISGEYDVVDIILRSSALANRKLKESRGE